MNLSLNRCISIALAILWVAQLVGCQGLVQNARLYSEKRDRQGSAAKASWEKVNLDAMIDTDRSNLNKLLEAQLDLQEQYALTNRDRKLRMLLVSDKKVGEALTDALSKELTTLIGKGKTPQAVEEALRDRQNKASSPERTSLTMAQLKFSQIQFRTPSCNEFEFKQLSEDALDVTKPADLVALMENVAVNARRSATLASAIRFLVSACNQSGSQSDTYAKFREFTSGTLQDALQDKVQDDDALANAKGEGQLLKAEFDVSSNAYQAAIGTMPKADAQTDIAIPASTDGDETNCVNQPTSKLGPAQVNAVTAAHRLCKAILQIEKANNAFASKLLSEERLKSLQNLVETINQMKPGDPVPADAGKLVKTYILLPGLVDEVNVAIDARRKPVAMSLLIQRNIDELKLEAAVREIALLENRAKLSRVIVEEMLAEADLLLKSKTNLNKSSVINIPMESAFTKANADEKITLYSALTNYADAIGRQEVKWRKARQQRLATFHEVALLYAEVNLKQWTSLIDTAVEQVSDSAADGIKSESITNLLNTVGLFYIGRGANK
jgi:hypothetical protein